MGTSFKSFQVFAPGLPFGRQRLRTKLRGLFDTGLSTRFSAEEGAWLKMWNKGGWLPDDAVFVLAHVVFCEIDDFDQMVFFRRTTDRDELWAKIDYYGGLARLLGDSEKDDWADHVFALGSGAAKVVSVRREGDVADSAVELLWYWLQTYAGAALAKNSLIASGYITRFHWYEIYRHIEEKCEQKQKERERIKALARQQETEIIRVARELRLRPEPDGGAVHQWWANCPSTGHRLMISTTHDQFGCGYCKRKGGPDELRAFVADRAKSATCAKTNTRP